MIAMDDVYREYSNMIFRYLLTLCGDEHLAEELTQETFYQAVRSADRYDGTCKVTTWLCAIAKNKWKEHLRRHPSTVPLEESLLETGPGVAGAEDAFLSRTGEIEVHKAIHRLADPVREVVQLRLLGGLSFREIAEVMDRTEEWARVTYYRGKLSLRKELEK
ncbi:MAG: sigma-70 family RNA polymerase sigma factor [Clostridiales bacterium]|nr:sigma-70 family RNA polymerase sigma factor [Clostridiales bacterium]